MTQSKFLGRVQLVRSFPKLFALTLAKNPSFHNYRLIHTFPKGISTKRNAKSRPEFEIGSLNLFSSPDNRYTTSIARCQDPPLPW